MSEKKLQLSMAMLDEPTSMKGMFDVVPFKDNFINNYLKTTGKHDGEIIWEREKVMFLQKVMADKKFEKCSRLSVYSSFIELAASGLSLNDGQTYIIPYRDNATFQIGWRGRLEQISQIESLTEINEPVVVYSSDDFSYSLGEVPKINKHNRNSHEHGEGDPITHVYVIYVFGGVTKCMIMEAQEVNNIRDNFSESYKFYVLKDGKWPNGGPMDKPFAMAFTVEYFKKTIVKRLYKYLPKSSRMVDLDRKIKPNPDKEESQEISYGLDESEMTPEDRAKIVEPEVLKSESNENQSF